MLTADRPPFLEKEIPVFDGFLVSSGNRFIGRAKTVRAVPWLGACAGKRLDHRKTRFGILDNEPGVLGLQCGFLAGMFPGKSAELRPTFFGNHEDSARGNDSFKMLHVGRRSHFIVMPKSL